MKYHFILVLLYISFQCVGAKDFSPVPFVKEIYYAYDIMLCIRIVFVCPYVCLLLICEPHDSCHKTSCIHVSLEATSVVYFLISCKQ